MGLLPFEKIERKVLIRKETTTDSKFGQNPNERLTSELLNFGLVNVNKPAGPTSHQVSAYLQNILNIKKSGHSGTLDPNVTGVLPSALGRATRIVEYLLTAGKEYVCIMHLHNDHSEREIKRTAKKFIGKIKQLPPIKSAVKRQWRYRKVYYLEILEIDKRDVLFKIGCQAGTYIRKICHDFGTELGSGAHMSQLKRTKAGPFKDDDSYTLQEIKDAYHYYKKGNDKYLREIILPIEKGIEHLPKIWVFDTTVNTLSNGANLNIPGISKIHSEISPEDLVAIMTLKGELIAVGIAKKTSNQLLTENNGIAVVVNKVFMNPGIYPSINRK